MYITGTFNNWEKQIPMHRSGNDFTYIHTLKVCVFSCSFTVFYRRIFCRSDLQEAYAVLLVHVVGNIRDHDGGFGEGKG